MEATLEATGAQEARSTRTCSGCVLHRTIHHATRDLRYTDEHGQLTLRSGALQMVFCDVSTPAAAGWNAYAELRTLLVRRGIDPGSIRYMQDAQTDVARATLFAACRDGTVSVLIGSTETARGIAIGGTPGRLITRPSHGARRGPQRYLVPLQVPANRSGRWRVQKNDRRQLRSSANGHRRWRDASRCSSSVPTDLPRVDTECRVTASTLSSRIAVPQREPDHA